MAYRSPGDFTSNGDGILLHRAPWQKNHPKDANEEQEIDMFVTLFDSVPKPTTDQSIDEEVKHHPDGPPIDVGLAVMPQAEGRNGIQSKVEVGVFFHFDLVIFHTLIGIENSRNQGKCEVVLEQLSVFIRKCGWDFL